MAKMTLPDDIVVFENSLGETISNDPRWQAIQTLEAAGISFEQSQPEALQAAAIAQAKAALGVEDTPASDGPRDYKDLDSKTAPAEAKNRGLDIKGLKKVSEIRNLLIADDAEKAAQKEIADANGGDDDEDVEDENSEEENTSDNENTNQE